MLTASAEARPTAVVIHGYPMVRLGVRATIEADSRFLVVGETAEPDEGYELVSRAGPNLVVLGMRFPGRTGFDVLRDLAAQSPGIRILIYCHMPMADFAERCLRAGAHGYVSMEQPIEDFMQAVLKIQRGQIYLSDEHSTELLSRLARGKSAMPRSPIERLSESELGVLMFVARGMSNREIARALHRSVKTVETYRTRIKRKLGVANATALAQFAVMHLDPSGLAKVVARAEGNTRVEGVRVEGVRVEGVRVEGVRVEGVRVQGSEKLE
jgi:DNA-binding NarL/FixJ family response regulator